MRILLVSHPPLDAAFGAAQIALHLGEALRARGHEVVVWSPEPLPAGWRSRWQRQRRAILRFAASSGPWDAIDVPGVSVSSHLARLAPVVARSVQPELLYLADDLRGQFRGPWPEAVRALRRLPQAVSFALAHRRGLRRARRVLCLGAQEYRLLQERCPALHSGLRHYGVAPSPADRSVLERVRRERSQRRASGPGARFLWIGRWASHKGTDLLLAFIRQRADAFPHDSFTLAGCGPQAARECPPDLVAAGRLRLVPSFRREELAELLAGHDAGLFTSRSEGWGLCLNEMLESGLPVFATSAGGVEDLRPFWGPRLLPFPPSGEIAAAEPDPEALASYFVHFSWEEIARRYEEEALLPAAAREAS